jgi:hypothetical protein
MKMKALLDSGANAIYIDKAYAQKMKPNQQEGRKFALTSDQLEAWTAGCFSGSCSHDSGVLQCALGYFTDGSYVPFSIQPFPNAH